MALDLANKYRPRNFAEVRGQDEAVRCLKAYIRNGGLPHCLLITGPSGVGKTTIARILSDKLGCQGSDFQEINCAVPEGAEMIKEIPARARYSPNGNAKLYYLDEAQSLTRGGNYAQQALLKVMEDYPDYAYFIIASTDPGKINDAIKTRCKKIELKPVGADVLLELVTWAAGEEGRELSRPVAEAIAENAAGSPRSALVALEAALCFDDEESQLKAVRLTGLDKTVEDLMRLLLWTRKPVPKWPQLAEVLRELKDQPPEDVRRRVLSSACGCTLKADGNSERAAAVMEAFQYDTYNSGFAGIVIAVRKLFA